MDEDFKTTNPNMLVEESCKNALISVNLLIARLADDNKVKDIASLEKSLATLVQQLILIDNPLNDD